MSPKIKQKIPELLPEEA